MHKQLKKLKEATRGCSHIVNRRGFRYHIDPKIMITIYNSRFGNGNATAAEIHVNFFDELCAKIDTSNIYPGVLRFKLFSHSLTRAASMV
jgi:hypothetical protein